MNICPNCGAVTRPGDNFCLNCGTRIAAQTPPPSPAPGDATIMSDDPPPPSYQWSQADANEKTIAAPNFNSAELPTIDSAGVADTIENPAYFALALQGVNDPQPYALSKTEITIGRAPNNDLVLAQDKDKLISRYHAMVRHENGTYLLRDNGSANGILVNGQLLDKAADRPLQDGDKLSIGDYTLTFCAPQSVAEQRTVVGEMYNATYSTMPGNNTETMAEDEGSTRTWSGNDPAVPPQEAAVPAAEAMASEGGAANIGEPVEALPAAGADEQQAATPTEQGNAEPAQTGNSVQRLTNLSQPLPDISALISAATGLNEQISALQQQLNAAHEATRGHEGEISTVANELRNEMQQLAGRLQDTITGMTTERDEAGMDGLLQLLPEVIRNPRDIDNARAFADKASAVNRLLQRYDEALKALHACSDHLQGLMGNEQ
ncbi:MAG: FHA domain-containing protein [Ktedonobacteraceae bacterium]